MPRIGRYEIEGEIGRGAMGVVYLARDPRLCRQVAVKTYFLPQGISRERGREFQERFLREAQAAACLSHPGIVTIYDADADPELGLPFIAMEFIPGRSLRQLLEMGDRLEPGWVFRMGSLLADALHVAHRAGIIHRDIKPANILLRSPDGAAKIADFGVARLSASDLTQTGASLGSPAYMSPEQIRGGTLDGRSDLFSLAIVLYEAICGKRPFIGEDLASLVYSIAHETPVPITRRVKGLPRGLDGFFERALAKDPGDRFPDAEVFREEFESCRRRKARPAGEDTVVAREAGRNSEKVEAEETGESTPSAPPGRAPGKRRRTRFLGLKFAAAAAASFLALAGFLLYLARPAHLKLDVKSTISSGHMSLEVDGREVYARNLSAPRSGNAVLGKLLGRDQESFEGWIKVSPGMHEVVAQVLPEGETATFRDSIIVELKAGEIRTLRMVAGRSFGQPVSLKIN